jgi:hypothetical protein
VEGGTVGGSRREIPFPLELVDTLSDLSDSSHLPDMEYTGPFYPLHHCKFIPQYLEGTRVVGLG